MIYIESKGNFDKTIYYLKSIGSAIDRIDFDKYGRMGVYALMRATPVRIGLTASSWYYEIVRSEDVVEIRFCNSNIQNRIPIAIVLQYGHGTRNGGWIEGRDYINPACYEVFEKLVDEAWKEVRRS